MNMTIAIQQGTQWGQPAPEGELAASQQLQAASGPVQADRLRSSNQFWSDLTAEELMAACRQDEGAALEELYRRYQRQIYAYVSRNLRRKELVADVVQEVFFRVYRGRKNYRSNEKFTTWLYKIARNLCIDETRRHWNRYVSRETDLAFDSNRPEFFEALPSEQKGVRDLMDENRKAHILEKALAELSERQREIIILNKFQGLTYREIGEITGQSPDAIKQHAYRAFLKLREFLDPYHEDLTSSY